MIVRITQDINNINIYLYTYICTCVCIYTLLCLAFYYCNTNNIKKLHKAIGDMDFAKFKNESPKLLEILSLISIFFLIISPQLFLSCSPHLVFIFIYVLFVFLFYDIRSCGPRHRLLRSVGVCQYVH